MDHEKPAKARDFLPPSFVIIIFINSDMTQITSTITDPKDATLIKKLLRKFDSVTNSTTTRKRFTGLDKALDDVKNGRVYHA